MAKVAAPTMKQGERSRLTPAWRSVIVAATALVLFAGAIPSDFVFDDNVAVLENPIVRGTVPLGEVFFRDWWGNLPARTTGPYRPFTVLAFWAEWRLGGGNPWFFHAISVLLHAAACVLLYRTLRKLTTETAAFAAAVFFSMVAASAEAVQAIVGQADVLGAMMILAGLTAHRREGLRAALLAAVFFALGLGMKETGVVAFVAWTAFDWIAPSPVPWTKRRGRYALYAALLAGYFVLRHEAIGTVRLPVRLDPIINPVASEGIVGRIFGSGHVFLERYVVGIVDPTRRLYECAASACGPATPSDAIAWLGLLLIVVIAVLPFVLRRRAPAMAAGFAWWSIFFLPVANLFIPATLAYGERLLYLPMMGLSLALAAGASLLPRRLAPVGWGILAVIAAGNAVAIQFRHADWRTPEALYRSALPLAPESVTVLAHNSRLAHQAGNVDLAEELARKAVRLQDGYAQGHAALAMALDGQNRPVQAEAEFRRALALTPTADLVADYATFMARQGRFVPALHLVRQRLRIDPDSIELRQLEAKLVQTLTEQGIISPP